MDDFIDRVIETRGDDGQIWLAQLPKLIEQVADRWRLTDIIAYENLSYNFVAHAKQGTRNVTLKLSQDKKLISDEYNALQYFAGNGVITVLAIDYETNCLLLQEAIPGGTLKNFDAPKIIDKISLFTSVVNKIASAPKDNLQKFMHVSHLCNSIDEPTTIPSKYIETAQKLRDSLLNSAIDEYLCHGDLHLDNIIQHSSSWLAIDPKGIVAEKAFEVAAFDLLSSEELAGNVNLSKRIVARNHSLAAAFNIAPQRLLSWFFLRLILSALWFIEDNEDPNKVLEIVKYIDLLLDK